MADTATDSKFEAPEYPWDGDEDAEIVANLTIGSLRDSLLKWLTSDRGVHAETLMVSIGALAGFAGQNAALRSLGPSGTPVPKGAVGVAEAGGERYSFGDRINGYLVRQTGEYPYPVWGYIAAAALQAGMAEKDMPDVSEMFGHTAKVIGTPAFGVPRAPAGIFPHLTVRKALEAFWPGTKELLSNADDVLLPASPRSSPLHSTSVAEGHWPLVVALVARQFILMGKDTLGPQTSLCLIMESAIAASKIDPKTIPQGRPAEN
jgi:hypothetical protein